MRNHPRRSPCLTLFGAEASLFSREGPLIPFNALGAGGRTRFSLLAAAQQLNETLKMRRQEILASQIGDDALFAAAVLPVSLHQADVLFELDPLGTFGSDRA
jgi:hypothetical protein